MDWLTSRRGISRSRSTPRIRKGGPLSSSLNSLHHHSLFPSFDDHNNIPKSKQLRTVHSSQNILQPQQQQQQQQQHQTRSSVSPFSSERFARSSVSPFSSERFDSAGTLSPASRDKFHLALGLSKLSRIHTVLSANSKQDVNRCAFVFSRWKRHIRQMQTHRSNRIQQKIERFSAILAFWHISNVVKKRKLHQCIQTWRPLLLLHTSNSDIHTFSMSPNNKIHKQHNNHTSSPSSISTRKHNRKSFLSKSTNAIFTTKSELIRDHKDQDPSMNTISTYSRLQNRFPSVVSSVLTTVEPLSMDPLIYDMFSLFPELKLWANEKAEISKLRFLVDINGDTRVAADQSIQENEIICSISTSICISTETATGSELADVIEREKVMSSTVALALHIMLERRKGYKSQWASWLDSLPAKLTTPLFWDPTDQEPLKGSPAHSMLLGLQLFTESEFRFLFPRLQEEYPMVFGSTPFSLYDFRWALSIVWSFGYDVTVPRDVMSIESTDTVRMILPLLDKCRREVGMKRSTFQCQQSSVDIRGGSIVLFSDRFYNKGEEITVCIGRHSNSDLIHQFGFTVPSNPFESIRLHVRIPEQYVSSPPLNQDANRSPSKRLSHDSSTEKGARSDPMSDLNQVELNRIKQVAVDEAYERFWKRKMNRQDQFETESISSSGTSRKGLHFSALDDPTHCESGEIDYAGYELRAGSELNRALLFPLRLLAATKSEMMQYTNALQGHMISARNESVALGQLESAIKSFLNQYETDLEADLATRQQIQSNQEAAQDHVQPSRADSAMNRLNVLTLHIEEKKLYLETLKQIKMRLQEVKKLKLNESSGVTNSTESPTASEAGSPSDSISILESTLHPSSGRTLLKYQSRNS